MNKLLLVAAAMLLPAVAIAQVTGPRYLDPSGGIHDAEGVFPLDAPGGPSFSRREIFALATSNTASAPVTTYGGAYILNQVCSTYGTVTVQALGPDGVTYQTIATYSAAPAGGGVALSLGSYQVVRVQLAGTAGCNIKLARVPA